MTIDEPVHQENQALATTGGGASASVEIEELEKLGERIAELSAQISAATYELLVMIRDFDGEGGSSWLPDGTHVSAETSRRLACDSARVEMRHAADGRVLDVGRRTRAISPALRRALEHRDGGCRFPGCGLRFCDAHHVEPWAEGGATSLKNTVLLCRRHHRTMHEDGFSMDLAPDGEARFYRPDGRPLLEAPALPLPPGEPVTALAARLAGHGVAVDAHATLPDWQGGPVDYGWAIDWLRYRDGRDSEAAAG